MNSSFYDQLGGVAGAFEQWGAFERTVLACALVRRVSWPGLKMVQRVIDASLQQHEDDRLERDANDVFLLANLLTSDEEDEDACERIRKVMELLPLLRTDNEHAKDIYMSAAPVLIQRCIDHCRRTSTATDLCRQLLTYLLIHPALTPNDQRLMTQWLRFLETDVFGSSLPENVWDKRLEPNMVFSNNNNNIWGPDSFRRTIGKNVEFKTFPEGIENIYCKKTTLESFAKNGRDVELCMDCDKAFDATIAPKSQRSNSLTPPSTNQISSSSENLSDEPLVQKPRSFSLSGEHSLSQIRPISVMYGTTGSETRLDHLRTNTFAEHPGMSMVAQWLKSLRLHKYIWLFSNISYEQMMTIDEEYLEKLGVTTGARHKLLLSIKKLEERNSILDSIESELLSDPNNSAMSRILERLREVLISPMPATSDIPAEIVKLLEIASKTLMKSTAVTQPSQTGLDDSNLDVAAVDPLSLHCWLIEKAIHHESFDTPCLQEALKVLRHKLPPKQFFQHVSELPLNRRCPKGRWRTMAHNSFQKRTWLPLNKNAAGPPQPRGKSHSYPPFPSKFITRPPPSPSTSSSDEYSSLDALCLQMTEQAIN